MFEIILSAAITGIGTGIGVAIGQALYNNFHNKAKDQKAFLKEIGMKLKDGVYEWYNLWNFMLYFRHYSGLFPAYFY